ncbi:DUF5753 domain-containing protein [Actinomadura xylanilytica]|uniref:DUF5753 domain-containing protein n=1 Tax=Actinomadura xylanilytica TaxID=887459 RepID=UPI00255AA999|nr:DUF5753 domain-containing protein [Actinomadura xylanilytica]MDL4774068.1 DUF5753 domain-containing protein [Actinomadura xylanilytica]
MPDDDRARALDAFIAELNRAWKIAGPPTYAVLEELSRRLESDSLPVFGVRVIALPKSTVNDLLKCRRRRAPRWQLVASFWALLRVVAIEGSVNPDRLGTLDEWRRKYEAIDGPPHEAPHQAGGAVTSVAGAAAVAGRPGAVLQAGHAGTGRSRAGRAGARPSAGVRPRTGARPGPGPVGLARSDALGRRPSGDAEESRRAWLLALTKQAAALAWWADYRDVVPEWFETYLSLEPDAAVLQVYEPRFIPGLLQTEGYARATIRSGRPGADAAEIDRRVELRMRRQGILRREGAPQLRATIDERVLRAGPGPGGAAMMRDQIGHLIEASALPNVRIQLLPAGAGGPAAALDGPVTHLRFPGRDIPDVVYLEQLTYALYPEKSKDVRHYWGVLARLAVAADRPGASVARLARTLGEF